MFFDKFNFLKLGAYKKYAKPIGSTFLNIGIKSGSQSII